MDRVLRFFNLYVCLDIALDGELAKLDQEAEFFASQLDEEDAVEDIKLNSGVIYAAKKVCESVIAMHRYLRRGQMGRAKRKYEEARDDAAYFMYLSESYRLPYRLENSCLRIYFDFDFE